MKSIIISSALILIASLSIRSANSSANKTIAQEILAHDDANTPFSNDDTTHGLDDIETNDLSDFLDRKLPKKTTVGSEAVDADKHLNDHDKTATINQTQVTVTRNEETTATNSTRRIGLPLTEEEENSIRLELIKRQIIERLGIPDYSPTLPNRTFYDLPYQLRNHFFPIAYEYGDYDAAQSDPFLSDDYQPSDHPPYRHHATWPKKQLEDDGDKTTEIVIFGTAVPSNECLSADQSGVGDKTDKSVYCFQFDVSQRLTENRKITSGQLWLFKQAASYPSRMRAHRASAETVALYETKVDYHHHLQQFLANKSASVSRQKNDVSFVHRAGRRLDQKDVSRADDSWLEMNLSLALSSWQRGSNEKKVLLIQCKTCNTTLRPFLRTNSPYEPYIVLKLGQLIRTTRFKRHVVECKGSLSHCCLNRLYVSFSDWAPSIQQPDGFWANYCRGNCQGRLLPAQRHSTLMMHREAVRRQDDVEIPSCCAPTKYSALSVLFWNADGYLIKRDLQNMIVDRCGCT